MSLSRSRTVTVRVESRVKWTDSEVDVGAGKRYQVTALSVHGWKDWFVPTGPGGYTRWWLAPFGFLRRARHTPWFGLIATVGRGEPHFIGEGAELKPSKDGRLEFYANDVPFM